MRKENAQTLIRPVALECAVSCFHLPFIASRVSGLAVCSLTPLMAFLGLYRKGCDRSRIEPFQADGLTGFFTEAIGAFVEPSQRRVDL